MYSQLDPEKLIATVDLLRRRISERFSDSGLSRVCDEVHAVATQSQRRCAQIAERQLGLRIGIGLTIVLILVGLGFTIFSLRTSKAPDVATFVQIFEAGLNSAVLIGAAILFLVTVEVRIKRSRTLKAIGELRSIAHVIDMHQLTKDPERLLSRGSSTESSPRSQMNAFELTRYLDYCTEMLSILGKVAALYTECFRDPVVVTSVNEVESLTTGLSRKIWQKIMILHLYDPAREVAGRQE